MERVTGDVAQVRPELDRRAQYVIDLLTNPITVIIIIYSYICGMEGDKNTITEW